MCDQSVVVCARRSNSTGELAVPQTCVKATLAASVARFKRLPCGTTQACSFAVCIAWVLAHDVAVVLGAAHRFSRRPLAAPGATTSGCVL